MTNNSCHAAAFASCRRLISPRSRNEPASASALERRSSVRSRSKNAAARAMSGLQPDGREGIGAARKVLDTSDFSVADGHDLEDPPGPPRRAELPHPPAGDADDDAVADVDERRRAQPVNGAAPEQRLRKLLAALARAFPDCVGCDELQ